MTWTTSLVSLVTAMEGATVGDDTRCDQTRIVDAITKRDRAVAVRVLEEVGCFREWDNEDLCKDDKPYSLCPRCAKLRELKGE